MLLNPCFPESNHVICGGCWLIQRQDGSKDNNKVRNRCCLILEIQIPDENLVSVCLLASLAKPFCLMKLELPQRFLKISKQFLVGYYHYYYFTISIIYPKTYFVYLFIIICFVLFYLFIVPFKIWTKSIIYYLLSSRFIYIFLYLCIYVTIFYLL